MNILKVFTKLWQPATECYPVHPMNFMFRVQNETSAANMMLSTNSTDGQNNSPVPIQSVVSNNLHRWIKTSSSMECSMGGSTVLSTMLPIEIQLGKLLKNKCTELPQNCLTNFASDATLFLGDSLDHIMRTTLNPSGDHNTPFEIRSSKSDEFTRISCFNRLYGSQNRHNNSPGTFSNAQKCFSTSPSQGPGKSKKKIPKLILIRNPLTWLSTKFDFRVLKSLWDPQFVEEEFKEGTVKAISTVTQILSDGKFEDLVGLLTKPARACLLKEVGRSWPGRKLKLIALSPNDIQISVPRKVYFLRISDKKFCDVDMAFMALKWLSPDRTDGMLFAEIFARFHREYTQHCIPEWTIAYFKVTRFDIVKK